MPSPVSFSSVSPFPETFCDTSAQRGRTSFREFFTFLKILCFEPIPVYIIFGCRDTVRRNERVISEYIKKQLEEDYTRDQISISEYIDPFTGIKSK